MHTVEVFCAIDPEDGREFVAVLTWLRQSEKGRPVPISHANFYASSAKVAEAKAAGWLAEERSRLAKQEQDAAERAAARTRTREASAAA